MIKIKRFFKRNSHNSFFRVLAGFGRSLNRLYENRNHDINSNGELHVIRVIARYKPSVIIDGGANVGNYSLLLNRFNPDCKIYAFEPVEDTFNQLQENTRSHKNIIPIKQGLFSHTGKKEINLFRSNTHSSLYEIQGLPEQSNQQQTITLIRGDAFLKANHLDLIDFLKIDVEGAEYEVLLGFEESIREGKIKAIQFEYGYINISTRKLLIDFYAFFDRYGYSVGKIFPKRVEFRKYEFKYEDFLGPNYIAVKRSEQAHIQSLVS